MKTREGYLMVDHRASPGLTEDFARCAGYDPQLVKEGKLFEADLLSCCHCQQQLIKNHKRIRPRETCRKCDDYVCDPCAFEMRSPNYVHRPFVKLVDDSLERACRTQASGNLYLPHLTKGP